MSTSRLPGGRIRNEVTLASLAAKSSRHVTNKAQARAYFAVGPTLFGPRKLWKTFQPACQFYGPASACLEPHEGNRRAACPWNANCPCLQVTLRLTDLPLSQ
jgi:hypothetical protein